MANHLDFLRALDDHVRNSSLGVVSQGIDLHTVAHRAGLMGWGDLSAARWTGQLVGLGYLTHGPLGAGDRRPLPAGMAWTADDVQRVHDYTLTPAGHQEADRTRRLERESATDAALGATLPGLIRPWMDETRRRAISEPLCGLRDALDDDRQTAAVGAAKDLVEAACKVPLDRAGTPASRRVPLPALFRAAHRAVAVDPQEPDWDLGRCRSLTGTVQRLAELRNTAGAGHGHAAPPTLNPRDARLAASAATALTALLLSSVDDAQPAG